MKNRKTLSFISSNYNHAHYLEEALEALTSQAYPPIEALIVDDASTDNSVEILERFAKKYPYIKVIKNEQNLGAIVNVRKFQDTLKGEYFHSHGSDDMVLPGFYEKSMDLLTRYPHAGLCLVDIIFVDEKGDRIGEERFHLSDTPRYFSPDEVVEVLRKKMITPAGVNSIYKRSAFIGVGGHIPELKSYSDFFPTLVLAFRYGICYIPEPLVVFRLNQTQYSAKLFKDKKAHLEIINYMLNLLNSPEYADVRPRFKESLALAYLFSPVIGVLLRNPDFRYYLSLKLILRTCWRTIKKKINPHLPLFLKNVYYYFRNINSKRILRSSLK